MSGSVLEFEFEYSGSEAEFEEFVTVAKERGVDVEVIDRLAGRGDNGIILQISLIAIGALVEKLVDEFADRLKRRPKRRRGQRR
jgi:hypothetical protein